jgi:actin-related protein
MYCGDETGSFIGEIGSHTCRFGYGGEDNPKLVVPSYVANKTHLAPSCLGGRVATQEIESILRTPQYTTENQPLTDPNAFLRQGDSVENWDNLQVAWHAGMDALRAKDTLKHTKGGTPYSTTIKATSPGEGKCVHPILAITPGFTQYEGYGASYCETVKRQQYVRYTEMLMESMEASSMFLAPSPMLAAFSLGRQTALVVDVGAGGCRVTPVVDGLVLYQSQRRNGRGGDWLGNVTWKALLEEKIQPKPRYLLRNASATPKSPLFHTWAMQDLMYELRTEPHVTLETYSQDYRVPFTELPSTPPLPASPSAPSSTATTTSYELPDGTPVDLNTPFGKDLCRIPDLLFTDTVPFSSSSAPSSTLHTLSNAPLHKLIQESLLAVGDVDARKELANSICLSGGASVFPNLDTRLSRELTITLPAFVKPKVIASRISVERSCASWIGASILTSLGSFQQLWLSRTEYEEYGATMSIQRFP